MNISGKPYYIIILLRTIQSVSSASDIRLSLDILRKCHYLRA